MCPSFLHNRTASGAQSLSDRSLQAPDVFLSVALDPSFFRLKTNLHTDCAISHNDGMKLFYLDNLIVSGRMQDWEMFHMSPLTGFGGKSSFYLLYNR